MLNAFSDLLCQNYVGIIGWSLARLVPIMLLKLPIMLWSNAPEFCLLCSNYAPYVSQCSPQIQHFLSLILLKSGLSAFFIYLFSKYYAILSF